MDHILQCPEGQVITLPPDGITTDDGILLSGNEVIAGTESEFAHECYQNFLTT